MYGLPGFTPVAFKEIITRRQVPVDNHRTLLPPGVRVRRFRAAHRMWFREAATTAERKDTGEAAATAERTDTGEAAATAAYERAGGSEADRKSVV